MLTINGFAIAVREDRGIRLYGSDDRGRPARITSSTQEGTMAFSTAVLARQAVREAKRRQDARFIPPSYVGKITVHIAEHKEDVPLLQSPPEGGYVALQMAENDLAAGGGPQLLFGFWIGPFVDLPHCVRVFDRADIETNGLTVFNRLSEAEDAAREIARQAQCRATVGSFHFTIS